MGITVIMGPMFVRMLPSDHSGDSCQFGSPSKTQKANFNNSKTTPILKI